MSTKEPAHRDSPQHIGKHIIADFWGCEYEGSAKDFENLLLEAAKVSNASVLDTIFHQFKPNGATALLLLAESHISIHTWPEHGYIAVDVFTCGTKMKPQLAIDYLKNKLKPERSEIQTIDRGVN